MVKKLQIQSKGRPDNFQTPKEAIDILIPYIPKEFKIWECAWGEGNLFRYLSDEGYNVVGSDKDYDFLTSEYTDFDCIITNPPYSIKDNFLEKCYSIGKPFALLLPITALEGKRRGKMYRENGIQLIIPNKRINFETPSGKGSGSWFATAWFCWGLNLPQDLMFVELNKEVNNEI